MTIVTLGIDLGKTICSMAGMDAKGHIVVRKRLRRDRVIAFAANLPRCVVAMEACCGAHHIGRRLAEAGHEVRLMPPEYVKPYVKAQKNDALDAEAIAEAATRPTMRFVTLKTQDQLDLQTLHRLRHRLVRARTALINQLRAVLLERGHTVAQGRRRLSASLTTVLATADLSPRISALIDDLRQEWRELDMRIEALDRELMARAREDEAVRRLMTIPGVGVLTNGGYVVLAEKAYFGLDEIQTRFGLSRRDLSNLPENGLLKASIASRRARNGACSISSFRTAHGRMAGWSPPSGNL